MTKKPRPSPALIAAVMAEVTATTQIGPRDMRAEGKASHAVATARWMCWRILMEREGFSRNAVADAWGCDPSSVQHAKSCGWVLGQKPPRPRPAKVRSKLIGPAIARLEDAA